MPQGFVFRQTARETRLSFKCWNKRGSGWQWISHADFTPIRQNGVLDVDVDATKAHPNAKLNANGSLELETMNAAKGHLFGYSFGTLVERTIRDRRREERRLAEQRATKHQFQARNSCILDSRNFRIARRLLLLARAQF